MQNVIVNTGNKLSSVSGTNAIDAYRIRTLIAALDMLIKTKGRLQPTCGFNMTYGLKLATQYTGNKYKRTEGERAKAELKLILEQRLRHIEIINN